MKVRINGIKLNIQHSEKELLNTIYRELKITKNNFVKYNINKKSIDARNKNDIKFVYSLDVYLKNYSKIKNTRTYSVITESEQYRFNNFGDTLLKNPPVIVGSGPAGLFCAYMFAKNGYRPVLIERGENVDDRQKSVEHFWKTNELNTESNVQFGEGGAGAFSDGKLNTQTKDKFFRNRFVLETFAEYGASDNILYDAKPHIGTDILCNVIKNIRNEIIACGGSVLFNTKLTDIVYENNRLTGLQINNSEIIKTDVVVLALGHSARDTFKMLFDRGIVMEQKPFAVGVRAEHKQEKINISQYGADGAKLLPSASYKLTARASNGRGVYSFCMCPGGYVVNASSEKERLAVNGMSYSGRNGENANSAIVVTVTPDDFESEYPLAGIEFQRKLENAAYSVGRGRIPVQTFKDFADNTVTSVGNIVPQTKGEVYYTNLRAILPYYVCTSIIDGIKNFGEVIDGFDDGNTILSAVESRTSCPVRIVRDENFECNIKGIYPCGEGAGYAGGIMSAAVDGIKIFEAIAGIYKNLSPL